MGKSYKEMVSDAKAARAPTFAEFEFSGDDYAAEIFAGETMAQFERRLAREEFDYIDHELHGGFGNYLESAAERGDDSAQEMLSELLDKFHALRRRYGFKAWYEESEHV